MHNDEEATHAKLTALLINAVTPAIGEHGGRIVKNTGDGFLAEFPSAVEAVRAAMQFQTRIEELTVDEAEDDRIAFRVGINICDVIVEPHDIFGDGVNIAARLESIAEPGGICISSSAYDHVRGKVGVEFADLGEQNLKNITLPVRAYAVGRAGPRSQAERVRLGLPSPAHLSIVVLPFANLTADPEQEYFVDGVTESLTTDLSRIAGAFVIARNTAFTFKGKAVDVKRLGRELKIRYVLEGSMQRSGKRLRVNVQLIDAESGQHLWAERFEKPVADLFDMQDEIVSRLANALNAQLIDAEAHRAERSPHPDSMDLYFQGMVWLNKGLTPNNLAQARSFFERALALDPGNIEALVGIATADAYIVAVHLPSHDRAARLSAAEAALTKVLSLSPGHARAHYQLGFVRMFSKRAVQGIAECERALELDRNLACAHGSIGQAMYFIGRGEETEAHVQEALRISPIDTNAYQWFGMAGFAQLHLGHDEEAVVRLRRALEVNPNFSSGQFYLAAAFANLDRIEEARSASEAGLKLDPSFTICRFRASAASDNPTYLAQRERIYEGMRKAGLPEG
jgi:TolB-like protein/Tfp pilus assembly protein PilF